MLLENYGYDVIDLGKDVPPELVVETAVEQAVKLVGLSALMTTTVPSMEETIRQLQKAAPGTKGDGGRRRTDGGLCKDDRADRYCRDAMASVNYAESLFSVE